MPLGQRRGKAVAVGSCKTTGFQHAIEPGAGRKLHHFYGKFDRFAGSPDDRLLVGSGNRHDIQIERGSEAAIEPQFLLAGVSPRIQRREVHKIKPHRLDDLVGEVAGQKNPGNMRFDEFNPLD